MGTTAEWMQVLEFGGIVGLVMLLLEPLGTSRVTKWLNFLWWLLALCYNAQGLRMANSQWGTALLFVGVLLVTFGAGLLFHRARGPSKNRFKTGLTVRLFVDALFAVDPGRNSPLPVAPRTDPDRR